MGQGARRPGEFELIDRYFRPLATSPGAFGLGDDAALFRAAAGDDVLLKTDLVAAGVHFFPDDPPGSIAKKALRVNLSDIASKGGVPVGYLLSLALPADWTEAWVKAFAAGLKADQKTYGVTLFGGDTSRAAGGLTVSVAAIGRIPRGGMVHRSGAAPGDLLYVSGTIGDAALALAVRLGRINARAAGRGAISLLDRYLHPQPRMGLAAAIRRYASAAMDVSDGLVGDFGHICRQSKVSGVIEAAAVPLSPAARRLVRADPGLMTTVLTGGDDYEILAAIPPKNAAGFERAARAAGVPVTRIGQVRAGKGRPAVVDATGSPVPLEHVSYDHFG